MVLSFARALALSALLLACHATAEAPLPKSPLARIEILPPSTDANAPIVVAVHGLGDRPDRFMHLLDGLDVKARTVFPAAPHRRGEGFAWWTASVRDGDPQAVAAGLLAATEEVAGLLEELAARHPTAGKPVITGFSQGGMLSFAVAARRPELVRGAVPIAGWLPEALLPTDAAPKGAAPIRALHGEADEVLPFAPTQAAVERLRARGFDASIRSFPGVGHTVSAPMREALYAELRAMLADQHPAP